MRDGTIKPEDVKVAGIESEEEKSLAEVHHSFPLFWLAVGEKDPFYILLHFKSILLYQLLTTAFLCNGRLKGWKPFLLLEQDKRSSDWKENRRKRSDGNIRRFKKKFSEVMPDSRTFDIQIFTDIRDFICDVLLRWAGSELFVKTKEESEKRCLTDDEVSRYQSCLR